MSTPPRKKYAVVTTDGTTTEFPTKKQAIACGEASGQGFTVLSPRGFEVHVAEAPVQPKPTKTTQTKMVLAEKLVVGMTVVGTRKREPIREITRISVGKKHVTVFGPSGADFGYWTLGTRVEVVTAEVEFTPTGKPLSPAEIAAVANALQS